MIVKLYTYLKNILCIISDKYNDKLDSKFVFRISGLE